VPAAVRLCLEPAVSSRLLELVDALGGLRRALSAEIAGRGVVALLAIFGLPSRCECAHSRTCC
jgi:hypothetical protein